MLYSKYSVLNKPIEGSTYRSFYYFFFFVKKETNHSYTLKWDLPPGVNI